MPRMNIPPNERQVLAEKCGINEAYLYQVLSGRREPSPELCVTIERESMGAIKRWDLRTGDWHRIWPELVGAEGSPEIQTA
jgi:DNA-binding transcriptional regulator YdaS (Cro superfamily)